MKNLVLLISTTLLMGQYSYAKLPTDAEVARIQKVMGATAQVQTLVKRLLGKGPQFYSEADKNVDDMLKTINQPDCKVVVVKPKDQDPNSSGGPDIRDSSVEITGEKCSLNISAIVKSVKDGNNVDFTITFNFESKSAELKALTDVDRISLNGPGSVKVTQDEKGMGGIIEMGYGGTIHSQTEGDVTLNMKQNQNIKIEMSNGQMSMYTKMVIPMEIKFSDFQVQTLADAELNAGVSTEKYTVNGEVVTKEVYDKISSQISVPGTEEE